MLTRIRSLTFLSAQLYFFPTMIVVLLLSSCGGRNDTSPLDDPNAPSAPVNLRGVVYTETEIEIFWDRSDNVVAYQILRDGVLIDTRDVTSFYDSPLTPATTYQYEVRAVDEENRIGPAATLFLTTRTASLTLTDENAESVLAFVVSIVNEEMFNDFMVTAQTVAKFEQETDAYMPLGFELVDTRYLEMGQVFQEDYSCVSNDGMLTRTFAGGLQDTIIQVDFDNCGSLMLEGKQINGSFLRRWSLVKYVFNPGGITSYEFEPMNLALNDENDRTLIGGWEWIQGPLSSVTWGDFGEVPFEYRAPSFEGLTKVTALSIHREAGATTAPDADPWLKSLRADFSVQAPQTGNKPVRVETLQPFMSHSHDGCFESGVLRVTGFDGSWLEVDAGTGDVNTYKLSIGVDEDSMNTIVRWNPNTALKPIAYDDRAAPVMIESQCSGLYLEFYR